MKETGLFRKTLLIMIVFFAVIAVIMSVYSGWTLNSHLTHEYTSKGAAICDSISRSSVDMLLNRDASTIQSMIDQFMEIKGVAYVFVLNAEGDFISHTFVPSIPESIVLMVKEHRTESTMELSVNGMGDIINIRRPILENLIGTVHVGMDRSLIRKSIREAIIKQLYIVTGLFAFSIIMALFFVNKIARPLRGLIKYVQTLTSNDFVLPETTQAMFEKLAGDSRNEVGKLAKSFVFMQKTLKDHIKRLKETTAARERIESELRIARSIQMSLLHKTFPPYPERKEFDLFAVLEPAREVGGDFYDFCIIDDRNLFFCVGDVSDKGVPAALFMSVSKTLMKFFAQTGLPPEMILEKVNNELCEENENTMFVTLFCGILNTKTGELCYSNAGHNPPIIIRSSGSSDWLELPKGIILGITPGAAYQTRSIMLDPGDKILSYTDGVTEAMSVDHQLYSDDKLLEIASVFSNRDTSALCKAVLQSVQEHVSGTGPSDDITILALEFKGKGKELPADKLT